MISAPRRRRASVRRRVRWAALGLGLLLALGGLWALVSWAPSQPPLDDIAPASRARLEQVLRHAEGEEARP